MSADQWSLVVPDRCPHCEQHYATFEQITIPIASGDFVWMTIHKDGSSEPTHKIDLWVCLNCNGVQMTARRKPRDDL